MRRTFPIALCVLVIGCSAFLTDEEKKERDAKREHDRAAVAQVRPITLEYSQKCQFIGGHSAKNLEWAQTWTFEHGGNSFVVMGRSVGAFFIGRDVDIMAYKCPSE